MSKSLLLCDDHVLVLQSLIEFLEVHLPDVTVTSTENFKTFMTLLKGKNGFDLAIVDYHMPGMEGTKTIKQLVANTKKIPIAIISGIASNHEILDFIKADVSGFIPKTHTGKEFIHAVELMLSGEVYIPSSIALLEGESQRAHDHQFQLTKREVSVLNQLFLGYSNKEIANFLSIEEITVKVYVSRLCKKFDAKNRTSVVVKALSLGMLTHKD
ncbi:MAG: response regulator transcription factor [Methylococcales bacterium]|nr:response regulator transcription factor [Methylococcales bacterium]